MSTQKNNKHPDERFCKLSTGVNICYRDYGDENAPAILLIAGLGQQLIAWPAALVNQLVTSGFRVIAFDNRDAGRSDRMKGKPPTAFQQLIRKPGPGYTLSDMANDSMALMDEMGISQCHLVGMSMGGMIAQTIAINYPDRVLSLTSIFSTTGALNAGQPAISTMLKLLAPPAQSKTDAMDGFVKMMRHIGPTTYDLPDIELYDYASKAWERGNGREDPKGVGRQIGAIMRSGDRTKALRKLKVPTLVIHGHEDLLVQESGGLATAKAIPNATYITIHGMGHYLPKGVLSYLGDLVSGHAYKASGSSDQRHGISKAS